MKVSKPKHRCSLAALAALALMMSLSAEPASASQALYTFIDENGVVHFSNDPADAEQRRVIDSHGLMRDGLDLYASLPGSQFVRHAPGHFQQVIRDAARRFGLAAALISAVIKVESDFNPDAISVKGAVGLMQLMPETALQYGVHNRHDPVANILAGAEHLSRLMRKYNDLKLSLAAYNAGEQAVERHGTRIPPFQETREYVTKVMRYYREFQGSLRQENSL
ncbi:MAG: lytic transglycosylase domain-containing protein [Magnetococcus sp. WYHC-3]